MKIEDVRGVFAGIQSQPTPAETVEAQDHQDGAPALLPESVTECSEFLRGSPKALIDAMCPVARPVIQEIEHASSK